MVILKPKGRGNWATMEMRIDGAHLGPLVIRVGEAWFVSGKWYRVAEVRP